MMRKGKRFLVLLTAASLSVNMLGVSALAEEEIPAPETDADYVVDIPESEPDAEVTIPDTPESDVPEISYEPIIIEIPDGPIPAGFVADEETPATNIPEEEIPTTDRLEEQTPAVQVPNTEIPVTVRSDDEVPTTSAPSKPAQTTNHADNSVPASDTDVTDETAPITDIEDTPAPTGISDKPVKVSNIPPKNNRASANEDVSVLWLTLVALAGAGVTFAIKHKKHNENK